MKAGSGVSKQAVPYAIPHIPATRHPEGETDSIVSSQIIPPDAPPVAVDWRIRPRGDALKVIDVAVEGVSMSVTQRSEFSSVIQRGGGNIEALLQSLRQRVGEAG